MELKKFKYQEEEYIFIDTINYKNKEYHKFVNDEGKLLFCKKENDVFIPIEKKRLISKLNNQYEEIKIKDIV